MLVKILTGAYCGCHGVLSNDGQWITVYKMGKHHDISINSVKFMEL